ncbi:MAG: hypothetical protein M3N82_18405 [Pseudomonadota bacterium]|nr:hypothetical protein [Pseudomonadota bacterium]
MTRLVFIAAMAALGGCGVLSNVTAIGDGAFMAAVHSNDVNARVDQETAQAMAWATSFCKERGATVDVIKVDAPAPPPGRPPSAEVDFRCKATS